MSSLDRGPQYIGLASTRNTEAVLRWSRASLFISIQSGVLFIGLPLIIQISVLAPITRAMLVIPLSWMGGILSIAWLFATKRADEWLDLWNPALAQLEIIDTATEVRAFSNPNFRDLDSRWPSFHTILIGLSWTFIIVWGLIGLSALVIAIVLAVK